MDQKLIRPCLPKIPNQMPFPGLLSIWLVFDRGPKQNQNSSSRTMLTANTTNRGNSKKDNKRTNKLETLKFVGGTKLMKELQKTLFFAAYDAIVSSGNSITEKRQKELLAEAIIGNGNSDVMTLTEQMATGINQFAHLYENVNVPINDDKNASSSGNNGTLSPRKILRDCYFPQTSDGGKVLIYANMPNGITKALLCAKSMNNPVDISTVTMMRGAKEVLRNGRKALASATDSDSDFKDGKLPSGRTLADYQKYICQSMFVKLKGKSDSTNCGTIAGGHADSAGGDDDDDDDDLGSTNFAAERIPNNYEDKDADFYSDPDNMPADYSFTGMIAFFMWGFIVDERQS